VQPLGEDDSLRRLACRDDQVRNVVDGVNRVRRGSDLPTRRRMMGPLAASWSTHCRGGETQQGNRIWPAWTPNDAPRWTRPQLHIKQAGF
jgi:hypothetical protein